MSTKETRSSSETGETVIGASSLPKGGRHVRKATLQEILGSSYPAAITPSVKTDAQMAEEEITARTGLSRAESALGINIAANFIGTGSRAGFERKFA